MTDPVGEVMALAVQFADCVFRCGVLHGKGQTLKAEYETRAKDADAARAALESRVRELERDAARIDWLEQNGIAIERDLEGDWNTLQYRRYGNPIRGLSFTNLRSAIDSARGEAQARTQEGKTP